jgi:hypothetical protein
MFVGILSLLTGRALPYIIAGLVAFAAGSAAGYWVGKPIGYRQGYNFGYSAAVAEAERLDREAANAARKAKGNVDQCLDAGGDWDVSSGVCADKPPGDVRR